MSFWWSLLRWFVDFAPWLLYFSNTDLLGDRVLGVGFVEQSYLGCQLTRNMKEPTVGKNRSSRLMTSVPTNGHVGIFCPCRHVYVIADDNRILISKVKLPNFWERRKAYVLQAGQYGKHSGPCVHDHCKTLLSFRHSNHTREYLEMSTKTGKGWDPHYEVRLLARETLLAFLI